MTKTFRTVDSARAELSAKFPQNDYSKYIYTNLRAGGIVVCPIHGNVQSRNFEKLINSKHGCPECGTENKATRLLSNEQAIFQLNEIHPDFDFSNIKYQGVSSNISFPCSKHGMQTRTYGALFGKYACLKCAPKKNGSKAGDAINMFRTTEGARAELKLRFPLNDYSEYEYLGCGAKSVAACHIHGKFITPLFKNLINSKYGCPVCGVKNKSTRLRSLAEAKNDLAAKHPSVDFSDIEYSGNFAPITFPCIKHGVQTRIYQDVMQGAYACVTCSVESRVKSRTLTKETFVNRAVEEYGFSDNFEKTIYINSQTPLLITCTNPEHGDYLMRPSNYFGNARCIKCTNPDSRISLKEKELYAFVKEISPTAISSYKYQSNFELDIYLSDLKIGIEHDGIHWHGEFRKPDKYHLLNKTLACAKLGIRVIHIFEDEWLYKKEIVKSRLRSILGKADKKIYARKCEVKEVEFSDINDFIEKNHIQGNTASNIKYALYNEGVVVAAMTFGDPRFHRKNTGWELIRYCSSGTVIGGFSKLLNAFVSKYKPREIFSYSDKRWSEGGVYSTNGFVLGNTSGLGYFWCKNDRRENRLLFQKHLLEVKFPKSYSKDKTEAQICHENGYWRIWDCGQDRWVKKF